MATGDEAVSAVDHGDIKSEFCARAAFQLIERLPKDEAIPMLIRHLGFREPLTNVPRSWQSFYPAVDSLARVGLSAELPLVEFLAQNPHENSIEDANALTALGLIRHGDVVPTIKLLRPRSAESAAGTPAAQRLDTAAHLMVKNWCWSKQLRQRCEERLRQPA